MRLIGATFAALALAACAGDEPPPPRASAPLPPPPVATSPIELPPADDACGAWKLQYLVGRPRSEIPVPVNPTDRRVTCTTCPVTMDYRQDRLNILFDARTGVIEEVKCG